MLTGEVIMNNIPLKIFIVSFYTNMKYIIIFLLFFFPLHLYAQESGVAVEESPFSIKVNPALMSSGNSSGIAWTGEADSGGLTDSYSILLTGRNLGYYYNSLKGDGFHNLALAFSAGHGTGLGTSLVFPEDKETDMSWNISSVIRPLRFLSLGLRTMDITGSDPYLIYGAGLRPFFFSPYWISRITVFSDLKYLNENEILTGGVRLEPVDGLNLSAEYSFVREIFEAGISLSLNHFTAGIKGISDNDYKLDRGRIFSYIPVKSERSVIKDPVPLIAEYDMCSIITDYPSAGGIFDIIPGRRKPFSESLMNFLLDMENIGETDEIKAVIFKNQYFMTSYANITEISDALNRLRKKGKKIYFYFDNAGNSTYTLAASAADEIFLNPSGSVNLRGYSKSSLYMKDFFSKFGVEFYNFRSHEYKTAYNSFSESEMTDEEKDVLDKLYTVFREKQIAMIEKGRLHRLNGIASEIISSGPYLSSREAEKKGLIDRRIYKDELEDFYREKGYLSVKYSSLPEKRDYDWRSMSSKILPVIYASGDIIPGNGLQGTAIGSEGFSAAVRSARENPRVECIVIRINSGGGSAFASDVIAREIALCREGDNPKPVIVSMGGTAASGGYYMAAPADIIFTDEVTVTGSIGVIALFPDLSGLLSKLGIKYEAVSSSDSSDFGNPLRSLSEKEIEKIKNYIAENYNQFLDIVKKYRPLTEEEADFAAQGKVWSGRDAVKLKLADRIGGLNDAVDYALKKYYTGREVRITESVPGSSSVFDFPFIFTSAESLKLENKLLFPDKLNEVIDFYKRLDQFKQGEALYLLPFTEKETALSDN